MKPIVLAGLCVLFGWAWGHEEEPEPTSLMPLQESCQEQSVAWCGSVYPRGLEQLRPKDPAAYKAAMEPHRQCSSDYARRCVCQRDPSQLVDDGDARVRAIAAVQRGWR